MRNPAFQSADWDRATTLTERAALLRAAPEATPQATIDHDRSRWNLERWRSQSPFTTDDYFDQRLALDGLTEDAFLRVLGETAEVVHERRAAPAAWLVEMAQAITQHHATRTLQYTEDVAGTLVAVEPLISQGRARFRAGVEVLKQAHVTLPFDPDSVEHLLFAPLLKQLITMLHRTMILELHVARLRGVLKGASPEARFGSFVRHLNRREVALALLQEYPVLARQITLCIQQRVRVGLEFLRHLCADWEAIRVAFHDKNDPGVLVHVQGGAGDAHREGRSVLIARFSSGFQVVYKPRPLAVEAHFQRLLAWLNQKGDHPPFRTLTVLDRGSHGWVEFVAMGACTSPGQVHRFYERQGGYLALLYAIEATDFHLENVVAAGEHPVLIDLEALFHPRVEGVDAQQSEMFAGHTMAYSVLRVGLLPQRVWANDESDGIELSGLGGDDGQLDPHPDWQWEGAGTDEMRAVRKPTALENGHHRPTLNGNDIDVPDYAEAIVTGFARMYRLLLTQREALLSEDGPLARFANDEVRSILRPTMLYSCLLQESFHPDLLRDALDRDRWFDRLWGNIERFPCLPHIIPFEREDLWNGDIPMFTTRPVSRDLWSSSQVRLPDFFDETALTLVHRRLRQLSEPDLKQQRWFIRASLTALTTTGDRAEWHPYPRTKPRGTADRERLLAAARAAGDRLETLALQDAHNVSWVGLSLVNDRYWSLLPLGEDLYDGTPGVALFLAYLGAVTQEVRYTTLAKAALTTARRQLASTRRPVHSIGGFAGWGSVIYTLTHLGTLWNQPALLAEAEDLVDLFPTLIEKDDQFEVIGGAAGGIGGLLSLYRCAPSGSVLAAAVQCGDWLIANAQPMADGIGWVVKGLGSRPLAGYSHGVAGIAWALLELAAVTGEERFRVAARQAITYERTLFSKEARNWLDVRTLHPSDQVGDTSTAGFMTAWCHGAPGVGLARLRTLPHLDDAEIRAEIDAAIQTTLAHGFGMNHSLCHGDLGNLELLLQASRILEDPALHAQTYRLAAMILNSIDEHGWLCGVPDGVETPGLMTGLAGIGYGLLRLAEPEHVPSVLVLEPPDIARVLR